jgi:catechol 2,3-dioxygenase-like lactoylglutathione lyase family enzyme
MARALIPELSLRDPEAGMVLLRDVFGFDGEGSLLRRGSQRMLVTRGDPNGRHGRVDHLALSVPDVPTALAESLGRGGRLSPATPDGPLGISEFWENGVDYVFLDGPEGAKVELIARRSPAPPRPWGHDHIGISCAALGPMRAFFLGLGFEERAAVTLERPEGRVEVAFLAWGEDVVELYSLPEVRADPSLNGGDGFWRLRAEGIEGRQVGPEGVEVLPLGREQDA